MRKRFAGPAATLALLLLFPLLISAGGPAAAAATAAAQQPLRVTVTGDSGLPLSGAYLELHLAGQGLVAEATTGPDGSSALAGPAGSVFWLRAWSDGHATVERPWVPAAEGSAVALALPALRGDLTGQVVDHLGLPLAGARVSAWRVGFGAVGETQAGPDGTYLLRSLRAGEHLLQVAAGGFQPALSRISVAAGRTVRADAALTAATASVGGAVTDARSGRPLAEVRVELVRAGWGVLAAAATGTDGRFSITAPPSGAAEYVLRLTAPGYTSTEAAPFALAAGGREEFSGSRELRLAPLFGAIWGFVLSSDEGPVAGAEVELQLKGKGTVATVTADAAGFFAFDQVRPGTYRLRAFPGRDWAPSDGPWLVVQAGEQHATRITPVSSTREDFGSGLVAGFVSEGGTEPVAGAAVTLIRGHEVMATTTTDDRGRYHFQSVPGNAGSVRGFPVATTGYTIRIAAPGYLPTDQPAGGPEGTLTVRRNELTAVDFHLQPSHAELTGLVLDDQNQPVAGASVRLYREGSPEAVAAVTADPGGSYRFSGLETAGAIRYSVTAADRSYLDAVPSPLLELGAAPGGHASFNLTLRPTSARLQGSVSDARGRAVPGAAITVLRPADGRQWQIGAGEDGWFALEELPAGPTDSYLVRVAGVEGAPDASAAAPVTPAGQRALAAHLALAPAAVLAGTVYADDGRPLPRVTVALRQEGSAAAAGQTVTDAQGRYQFTGLVPGDRYAATAAAPGYLPSSLAPDELVLTQLVTAGAGETARFDIVLAHGEARP